MFKLVIFYINSIYKMSSLPVLLNRAVSYFNKSNNEMNKSHCERSDEISTDDEAMLYDNPCKYLCSTCEWSVLIENYNFERERCSDCCLLTQDEETQCVTCQEFKHITLHEPRTNIRCKQCANASRKIKKHTAIHANVLYNGVAGDITLNRKNMVNITLFPKFDILSHSH
jgi:hypothetical protein